MFYLGPMKGLGFYLLLFGFQTAFAQNFIPGRTTGLLPFLEYGTGDDRLGGAKMTYLDSNILVRVVDSINTDYKVQLSSGHFAYLSRQFFIPDTSLKIQPTYLTSSWRVWGDSKYDYISVGLPERLPYSSIQQVNPTRLIVNIYGAVSNTNWITQLKTAKEVRNVWYEQVENDVFRIIIDLRHQQHWGHYLYYDKNTLYIRIKQQPSSFRHKNLCVAIDAGHGGTNAGATGMSSGIQEKDYTLKIARQLQKRLRCRNFKVFMTRKGDEDLNMTDRTLMLRKQDPDILVSIHLNSSRNAGIKGVSTYYRYIGFRSLSQKILDRMLQLGLNNFGNVGAFNFSLSGPTEYPNCLVEVAFLSNAEDEKKILDERFHKNVSKKISKGICDWLRSVR